MTTTTSNTGDGTVVPTHARYAHEYDRRLRVGLVGCGEQSLRNILPALRFCPVDLVAMADIIPERARKVGQSLGVERIFGTHTDLAESKEVDVILLATGYDTDGRALHARQAGDIVERGCHVWAEKPPASNAAEIVALANRAERSRRSLGFGFMKMFTPAMAQIHRILASQQFGAVTSVTLRDPEQLMDMSSRNDPQRLKWLLDHVVHSLSVLVSTAGRIERVIVERADNGAAAILLRFEAGAIGTLVLPWGQSGMAPKERLEIAGQGESLLLENTTRLTYYRAGALGRGAPAYGRVADMYTSFEEAPLLWDLQTYSGEPYNMHVFYQGYAPCLIAFFEAVMAGQPVRRAGLRDAHHIMEAYDAILRSTDGVPVDVSTGVDVKDC
ncbi:Gfo/Idh/MocA family oxidoreductase [Aestuariivita sp.]|jgi:predicted dehydrogenase|uniref:Gfo/Idh/MocA family protein n=1 Tax=Aestuariivita sp. TaxID=1872407 RepID=UPI00216BF792|nr:Gfo/Idh/MocA family oxidoreductase [Aestuariivita sp.]MCE8008102.1 Gfo/Idh/MocA family oxidoreductase [Aestuariivita sp.]